MSETPRDLYRALAELAYTIALSDGTLQESERQAFLASIQKKLGEDYWIAESRFEILEESVQPSLDSAYNYTLLTLRRNWRQFSEELRDRFLEVMDEVSQAYQGKSPEEEEILSRFKNDLLVLEQELGPPGGA